MLENGNWTNPTHLRCW